MRSGSHGMTKMISSAPAEALAAVICARSEPPPLSLVFETTYVVAKACVEKENTIRKVIPRMDRNLR